MAEVSESGAPAGPATATEPPTATTRSSGRARPRRKGRWLVEWLVVVAVAVVVAVVVRAFVFETYYIPSDSMEPTLMPGDRIVVDKLAFDFHPIERGDIVVFRRPATWPKEYPDLVKRVIGLPGETISARGGNVYIDGHLLPEPWLSRGITTSNFGPVRIPKGEYFVMGDNRPVSADSRYFGPVPRKDIVGEVVFRYWPLSRIGGV
ncbi:signal peptidase I [Aciditerrimonas ferrireducens]|uniref:Signal peptidase I n=1 Tax=Aciditerrimonas ferrireducens TaxID=667306 RepID=A0ABV6C258_9ACTN